VTYVLSSEAEADIVDICEFSRDALGAAVTEPINRACLEWRIPSCRKRLEGAAAFACSCLDQVMAH
jgi:hypothetical protein